VDHPIFKITAARAVLFDGAMGTEIQRRGPSPSDFDGHEGLNEILVVTRPELITDIHRSFLDVGCDVIETNSFGSNTIVLGEYGLEDRAFELNKTAAEVARAAADGFSSIDRPRFVSGSVGPGSRLPSLGQISFADLRSAYEEQVSGLLAGGADLIQIETCQDPLQARAALIAAWEAMNRAGRRIPLFCQLTFETNGTLLLGTDAPAATTSLASIPGIDVLGINCATGPDSMYGVVRELSRSSPHPISVLPNAGLPEVRDGNLVYDLGPDEFAEHTTRFVKEYGVSFVGGCCGTTPEYIRALALALDGVVPAPRSPTCSPAVSSLFSAVTLDQDPPPLIIGERTNSNGSKAFRDLLDAEDLDGMTGIARAQADEGAHLLDVCLAMTGRDEPRDAAGFIPLIREGLDIPIVFDSTDPDAIETALENHPGRSVVNSVNLEDGGKLLDRVARTARRHGAMLVALCIDEQGMCMTADSKVACAERLVRLLTKDYGFQPCDILIDPLTFTLASGDAELKDSAVRTIEAVARIKKEIPGAYTTLGISNVSFGLKPPLRRVLNSVFLHHAIRAGLDAAILNAGKVVPMARIPDEVRGLAEDVIFNRSEAYEDPIEALMSHFESGGIHVARGAGIESDLPVEERLKIRVMRGDGNGLAADLDEAIETIAPLDIVNDVLLQGMKEVGALFGRGEMQLPFVLKSAEVVKAAVGLLEPRIEGVGHKDKGTFVIATVRGDVHDIGKNLVDMLLSNNGYRVVNLGTRQPIESVIEAAQQEGADAVGLSGLLVKSTLVMRDDLAEMERRGVGIPVLLGGAALNSRFVEEDLRQVYGGEVTYCGDAFHGLQALDRIIAHEPDSPGSDSNVVLPTRASVSDVKTRRRVITSEPVRTLESVPEPPFHGTRVEPELPLDEVAQFVDRTSLFKGRWQFKQDGRTNEEWADHCAEELEPMFASRMERYRGKALKPCAIWGLLPANSDGDSVIVFDEDGEVETARFEFPRQSKPPGLCLADYVLPLSGGLRDVLGIQLITMGADLAEEEKGLFRRGSYSEYLFLHGLGVQLAEASAEYVHKQIRKALGIAEEDPADVHDLLKGDYRGRRYSFGYPACPNLEDQRILLELLGAGRIGVTLTDELQMVPELSTSALILHHPDAAYFSVRRQD